MNSFEQFDINREREGKVEINLDKEIRNYVDIDESDISNVNENVKDILGTESLNDEGAKYYSFSSKERLENFIKNNIPDGDNLLRDNASFYINPETKEKMFFNCTSEEEILKIKEHCHDLEKTKQAIKNNILSSFAHETAHTSSFFSKHGNKETANMWEQEQICVYIGEKIRGDISDLLYSEGLIKDEGFDDFDLDSGSWKEFKKGKGVEANFFYPFLVKEYGLGKIRDIWNLLQKDSNIEKAIEIILKKSSTEIINDFKEKIKDRDYLKNIYN